MVQPGLIQFNRFSRIVVLLMLLSVEVSLLNDIERQLTLDSLTLPNPTNSIIICGADVDSCN